MKNRVLCVMMSLLILTGCGSMKNMSREERAGVGAQIGAFVGWLFGGAVGNAIDDDIGGDIGAFVGTAVGGIAGAHIAANTGDQVRVEKRNPGNYTPSSHVLLPDLKIEDILLEEDSVSRDNKINAGETCRISLVIVNNSFQDALDVEPIVKVVKGKYLKLSEPVKIAKITRDDRITYNVTVQASPKLRTGEAVFSVRLRENRGNGTEEETFTVETMGN
ncbi:glycine zipper family protein [uncultured Parabacteroides sp.]|uniref:glycine zipper family protein n=1 Tax=uncultured Parabacteroides sp. TaxID=512312 RepID=UPI00265B180A|nr:glycine zipper family protein [uncultured Parabacteroides sp.]